MTPSAMQLNWLRSMRRLTRVLIGSIVLLGLILTWSAVPRGDVLQAGIGAGVTLAALAAGSLWATALRIGLAVMRLGRQAHRSDRRIQRSIQEASQARLAARDVQALAKESRREISEQTRTQVDGLRARVDALLARVETFSKLHDDQADRLDRRVKYVESAIRQGALSPDQGRLDDHRNWSDESSPPGDRTVAAYHQLVDTARPSESMLAGSMSSEERSDRLTLRQEFAGRIHRHDYFGALEVGDEIVRRYPSSAAASDFLRVRPHLIRRAELEAGAAQRG